MNYNITFENEGKKYSLLLLTGIVILSNVESLADTADIILPEAVLNSPINIEKQIKRGTKVNVQLGYDGNLKDEFSGYVLDVETNNSKVTIKCEDELYNFRFGVDDKQFKNTSTKEVVEYLISQMQTNVTARVPYDIGFEKFTIYRSTAYDALKKIAESTKANIYFDRSKNELVVEFPYKEKNGEVTYDLSKNVETSNLEFKRAIDRKVEVIVESTNQNGEVTSKRVGEPGGDSITIRVGGMSETDIDKVANAELIKRNVDKLEGTLTGWLLPIVRPTFSAKIIDPDYDYKNGTYYVSRVETRFDESGGKRIVTLDAKLS